MKAQLKANTITVFHQFGTYVRDGKNADLEGADPDRLAHYRFMIFNTVKETLEQAFPITSQYLPEKAWHKLVHTFFSTCPSSSPVLWKMPYAFFLFVQKNKFAKKLRFPCLDDLLWFEWLEIEVYLQEDIVPQPFRRIRGLLKEKLVVNPEHRLVRLHYPVHLQTPDIANQNKGEYFLLIFRQPRSGKLQFVGLSKHLALILKQLESNDKCLDELLQETGILFDSDAQRQQFYAETELFIRQLIHQKFILGAKK